MVAVPFEFSPDTAWRTARQTRGKRSHLTGLAAEDSVCRQYQALGYELVDRRKRCPEGEIDLLMRLGPVLVAVEVKASVSHQIAAEHATPAQLRRISMACERCMQEMAGLGISDMRLDLALVDVQGRIARTEGLFID